MKKYTKEEWMAEGECLFGKDVMKWRFVCPSCGHVQSVGDFKPYKDNGATPDTARVNCIGRYDGHMDQPIGSKPGPCNYTSGGLFNLNRVLVVAGDKHFSSFEFDIGNQAIAE